MSDQARKLFAQCRQVRDLSDDLGKVDTGDTVNRLASLIGVVGKCEQLADRIERKVQPEASWV